MISQKLTKGEISPQLVADTVATLKPSEDGTPSGAMLAAMGLGAMNGSTLGFSTMPYYQPGYGLTPIPAWAETGAIWAIRLAKWTTVAAMFLQTAGNEAAFVLDNYLTGVLMASSDDEAETPENVTPNPDTANPTEGKTNQAPDSLKGVSDLNGKTLEEAEKALEDAGFAKGSQTRDGYINYKHPDGSRVFIRPNGEVGRLGPKIYSNNEPAYPTRFDSAGNRIQNHNTGETVIR